MFAIPRSRRADSHSMKLNHDAPQCPHRGAVSGQGTEEEELKKIPVNQGPPKNCSACAYWVFGGHLGHRHPSFLYFGWSVVVNKPPQHESSAINGRVLARIPYSLLRFLLAQLPYDTTVARLPCVPSRVYLDRVLKVMLETT